MLVAPGGERSFVADRGAADLLAPGDLRPAWFAGADALHLPVYSLLGEPLGAAGRRAIELARAAGAAVSVDLASIGPLLAGGRRAAHGADRATIARTSCSRRPPRPRRSSAARSVDGLLDFAADGGRQARAEGRDRPRPRLGDERVRFEVATEHLVATDTTGAGDAFDAGFLVGWFAARAAGRAAAGVAPARGRRGSPGARDAPAASPTPRAAARAEAAPAP